MPICITSRYGFVESVSDIRLPSINHRVHYVKSQLACNHYLAFFLWPGTIKSPSWACRMTFSSTGSSVTSGSSTASVSAAVGGGVFGIDVAGEGSSFAVGARFSGMVVGTGRFAVCSGSLDLGALCASANVSSGSGFILLVAGASLRSALGGLVTGVGKLIVIGRRSLGLYSGSVSSAADEAPGRWSVLAPEMLCSLAEVMGIVACVARAVKGSETCARVLLVALLWSLLHRVCAVRAGFFPLCKAGIMC